MVAVLGCSSRWSCLAASASFSIELAYTAITLPRVQRSLLLTDRRGVPSSRYREALLARGWGEAQYRKFCGLLTDGRVESQSRKPSACFLLRVPVTHLTCHTVAVSNGRHQGSIPQFVWVTNGSELLGSIPQILCVKLSAALGVAGCANADPFGCARSEAAQAQYRSFDAEGANRVPLVMQAHCTLLLTIGFKGGNGQ
jgi:hypothetical protein